MRKLQKDRVKTILLCLLITGIILLSACSTEGGWGNTIHVFEETNESSKAESTTEESETSRPESSHTEVSESESQETETSRTESSETEISETEPPEEVKVTSEPHRFSGFYGFDQTPSVWVRSPLILTGNDFNYCPEVDTLDYYYSVFDEFHRKMYEAIIEQIGHTNEPGYRTYIAVSEDLLWPFADDFRMVLAAVMDDHPELYRYDETYAVSWNYDEKQEYDEFGNVRIYLYQTQDLPGFWEELEELDYAAEDILSDIDRSQGEYDLALQIHDKLIRKAHYYGGTDINVNGISYSQTLYGILIDNGAEENAAVCEGYSDAYSYLMRRCGIQCIPIAGLSSEGTTWEEAVSNSLSKLHEWNLMRIDGVWYETDITYDDFGPESRPDYEQEALANHPEMLWGVEHYFFAVDPEEMYHMDRNEPFIYYTDESGQNYSLLWDHYAHIRGSDPRAREIADVLGDIACYLPDVSYDDQFESAEKKTGWQKENGEWYYYNETGVMLTGWQTISDKTYFFKPTGVMAANEWCDGWWLNSDGTWTYKYQASWQQNSSGWYYQDTSGWYAKNTTITIDGQQYTFDANGYLRW